MKNIFTLLLTCIAYSYAFSQSACPINEISTNPENPTNPNRPSDLWLNHFAWYGNDGGTDLYDYALHDMLAFSTNQFTISNPFSDQNSYDYLTDFDLDNLDMFPEDGWELLSVNLGSYPNGQNLSAHVPPQQSQYAEIPYLLLYNKHRGIIRLFANTLTGLNSNTFDFVEVMLEFESPQYSGLLRHNNNYDQALDMKTEVRSVVSLCKHPNNSMHWFHADFQVGYDPCTCLYKSEIRIKFNFLKHSYINMSSNSISLNVPLLDSSNVGLNSMIPHDFLTNVQINDYQAVGGIVIYNNMEKMVDAYLSRLEYVGSYNSEIPEYNRQIKRKQAVLKAFKQVVLQGMDTVIIGDLATQLSTFAHDLVLSMGIPNHIKVTKATLTKAAKDVLGKGFDWVSSHYQLNDVRQELPGPNMPTAMLTQTIYEGSINDTISVNGPKLFNPGTFPNATGPVAINPHNYPVYNEVLGLFALLETPKIITSHNSVANSSNAVISHSYDYSYLPSGYNPDCNGNGFLDDNLFIGRVSDVTAVHKINFKLKNPLKFVFNPAAGIDIENVDIHAAIVMRAKTHSAPDENLSDQHPFDVNGVSLDPYYHFFTESVEPSSNWHVQFNNVDFSEEAIHNEFSSNFAIETPFVPLDMFNDMVAEFQISNTSKWKDNLRFHSGADSSQTWEDKGLCDFSYPFNAANAEMLNFAKTFTAPSDISFELKLMVDMPFLQPNHHGQQTSTSQVFTYQIPIENIENLASLEVPFSLTQNPLIPNYPLTFDLTFADKNWSSADCYVYGFPLDSNSPLFLPRPFAIETINVNGPQTKDDNVGEIIMTAGEEIIVSGNVTIPEGFTLRVENFAGTTSSATPLVDSDYIFAFCSGQTSASYLANQAARIHIEDGDLSAQNSSSIQINNPLNISIYPNPCDKELILKIFSGLELTKLEILGVIGNNIQCLQNNLTSSNGNIKIDTSSLPSGTYNLRCSFTSGETLIKTFIVAH